MPLTRALPMREGDRDEINVRKIRDFLVIGFDFELLHIQQATGRRNRSANFYKNR